jgi:hypothetical protein
MESRIVTLRIIIGRALPSDKRLEPATPAFYQLPMLTISPVETRIPS